MKAGRQTTLTPPDRGQRYRRAFGLARDSDHAAGGGRHRNRVRALRRRRPSDREIRANVRAVTATEFATVLGDATGPLCSTAEHVLAALSGLGVDNAVIEIDGPEVPIMDGSAAPFVEAIDRAGLVTLPVPRRYIRILKPVRVAKDDCYGELRPHPQGFRIELDIDFDHPLIGRQGLRSTSSPTPSAASWRARAPSASCATWRSSGARATRSALRSRTRWWSTRPACSIPEGLRFADEFVRHKALDAIGDLALAGAPMLGAYRSVRGGHKLNHAVLSALMADPSAWVLVEGPEIRPEIRQETRQEAPRRAIRGHADLATGLVAPAYGPDVS